MREFARRWQTAALSGGGTGTPQAVNEREVIVITSARRLQQLDIGDESLVFGRIDNDGDESFHIGRVAVSSEEHEPLVIDWRAPAAEPFYRATGRHPLGLVLRRHLATEGRTVTGLEDEHFGAEGDGGLGLAGTGALLSALERERTGKMRDIVATVQREQDEVIRAELPGVLVVQGGPGTGKTAVALHRCAYLLFTHRNQLERQGVLVVGPNPIFLRYIDRVLPALGESGAELSTIAGLVGVIPRAVDTPAAARVKSDVRMARVVQRAVQDRERRVSSDASVWVDGQKLTVTVHESERIVAGIRRRPGPHNDRRRLLERALARHLHAQYRATAARASDADNDIPTIEELHAELRGDPAFKMILDRMWPRLSPGELLNDLFGVPQLARSAGRDILSARDIAALHRERKPDWREVDWTAADIALLDEAHARLGHRRRSVASPKFAGAELFREYGHIVVDEAQDLSPMQLRMLGRRSMSGSMTVVGDIAQATGPWAPRHWDEVLAHLPNRRGTRVAELRVNYRTPAEIMDLACRVLAAAAPHVPLPTSARSTGAHPRIVAVAPTALGSSVADAVAAQRAAQAGGTTAVICAPSHVSELDEALIAAGVNFGEATRRGLQSDVTLVSVDLAKGLEFDSVIVIEPARIARETNLRALYVALTRATKRLTVIHAEPLPPSLAS
jgi:DNA helicase IV